MFLLAKNINPPFDAIDCHNIPANIDTPMILIKEPEELTMFHAAMESGKSEYRRGMPCNPKKCWGKKVRLTPMNMMRK